MSTALDTAPKSDGDKAQLGAMLSKALPELAVFASVAWMLFAPAHLFTIDPQGLTIAAIADATTLMLSATLIDIASRLRRAPPWWLGLLIAVGVLLAYPDTLRMLRSAWDQGTWIFVSIAWSILERLRAMWTLPAATPIEKIRRRTLTFDRLYTALVLGGVAVAWGIINAVQNDGSMEMGLEQRALPWLMLVFYGIAAGNAWRVHQPRFTQRPRSLWPRIDGDQNTYLDPL